MATNSDVSGAEQLQTQRKLGTLQDKLEAFIENLRSVGVIAGDFQQNGQMVLNDRL